MLTLSSMTLKCTEITQKIEEFISEQVDNAGLYGAVVAVSGGIDSAVTLSLTARALGPERVRAVTMPERDITPKRDITDVMQLVTSLNVTCDTVEITPVMDVMREILPLYDASRRVEFGNLKARTRMIFSYHYANSLNSMVMGSSNRTEWLTGYFTKHGDGGVDLMPIADLYKNQVKQLAKYLEVPENIIKKPPSAGFWRGQTDEGELGISYDTLDIILYGVDSGMTADEISEDLKLERAVVQGVFDRVRRNEHKRRLPLILRLRKSHS